MTTSRANRLPMCRSGLTLIEVLFALSLLVITAGVLAALYPMATVSRTASDQKTNAVRTAARKLEELRSVGYDNLTSARLLELGIIDNTKGASPYSFTNVGSTSQDRVSSILPNGVGTITVTNVAFDTRRITVTVGWSAPRSAQSVSLTTLIAKL